MSAVNTEALPDSLRPLPTRSNALLSLICSYRLAILLAVSLAFCSLRPTTARPAPPTAVRAAPAASSGTVAKLSAAVRTATLAVDPIASNQLPPATSFNTWS